MKIRELELDLSDKARTLKAIQQQISTYDNLSVDREYEVRQMTAELRNQTLGWKRAGMLSNRLLQELTFSGPEEKELVSQDMKLRATRRKFEVILIMIITVCLFRTCFKVMFFFLINCIVWHSSPCKNLERVSLHVRMDWKNALQTLW